MSAKHPVPGDRMWDIADAVYSTVDNLGCNWREEYSLGLALLDSAFDRAPAECKAFLMEKLIREELPAIGKERGVLPFVLPDAPTGRTAIN